MWNTNDYGQDQLTFLNLILVLLGGGMAAASFFSVPVQFTAGAGLTALLAAVLAWRRNSRRTWLALAVLFFILGLVRMTAALTLQADDVAKLEGEQIEVSGVLLEAPRISVDAEGIRHLRYVLQLEEKKQGEETLSQSGRVYVYATEKAVNEPAEERKPFLSEQVCPGDRLTARGYVSLIRGYGNPGMLNPRWAAEAQGITAAIRAGGRGVTLKAQEHHPPLLLKLRRWAEAVRQHYLQGMEKVMPAADAAAIFAMLFGGYEGIKPELLAAFSTTGIVHILSVSGSHITLLAGTLARLGVLLKLKRGIVALLVIVAVVLYGFLAGGVPPVVRSGAMGILSFLALVWGREQDARRLLTVICLLMLLYEPRYLFDISFQLSFGATAGLLYLAPAVTAQLARIPRLPQALALSVGVTCGAQLFVLPLIAWYFHVVSLSAFPANLLAVPPVELIIMLGLAAGLLGFVVPVLANIIYVADSLLLGFVYELTRLLALLPGSKIYLPSFGPLTCGVYYLFFIICLQREERRAAIISQIKKAAPFGAALLCTLLLGYGAYSLVRPSELQVHFIDVGQGDAALFITPHGKAFMIDTGGTRDGRFDVGARVDVPYLLHYGVQSLEAIFLTHAHEDHAAGAGGILRSLPVKNIFCAHDGRQEYIKALRLSAAEQEQHQVLELEQGMGYALDGVKIEVIYAPQAEEKGRKTGNEICNVIRVSYGKASFLITGDITKEEEMKLLRQANPQSTVLKVAHHGSKTSSSQEFLNAVAPRWAVISVGRGNTFGHPHRQTLEALEKYGTEVLRTDRDGAVVFRTDGERMRYDTQQRWH